MYYIDMTGKDLSKSEKFLVLHGKAGKLKEYQFPTFFDVSNYAIIKDDEDPEYRKLVMFTGQGLVSTSSKVVVNSIADFWDFTTDPETSDGKGRIGFERVTSRNGMEYISLFVE